MFLSILTARVHLFVIPCSEECWFHVRNGQVRRRHIMTFHKENLFCFFKMHVLHECTYFLDV